MRCVGEIVKDRDSYTPVLSVSLLLPSIKLNVVTEEVALHNHTVIKIIKDGSVGTLDAGETQAGWVPICRRADATAATDRECRTWLVDYLSVSRS